MEVLSIKKKRTQLNGSTFISGLMVCLWDNIFGPRTEQVWDGLTEVPNEILDNFCRNILCGEISNFDPADTDKNSKNSKTSSKFHLFPQFDYILCSVVFTARFQTTSTKWAICLMVPKSFLKRYLLIHHIIEDHLTFFTCILQQLLENKPASVAMDTLNYHLDLFVTYTNALNNEEKLIKEIRFNQSVFANIESDKKMEVKFLALAITSHLQTHGSTVVIGSHVPDIDQMIDTLAIFLTPDERERSSYVVEGRKYIPDLLLQGLLKQRVSDGEAIQSLLPTTIIDLDKQQINQTQAYHIHCLLRKENRKMQVKRAATSSDYYATNSNNNNNNNNNNDPQLFKQVREASSFIETMLEEVFRLPIVLRKGMLLQIRRLLIRRSIVLIKYVDKKIDGNDILQNSVIRKMRTDLQLLSDADFGIALAIAHKYSPNIYYALAGDPATIENKFFELFFL